MKYDLVGIIITIVLCFILIFSIILFLYYSFDQKDIQSKNESLSEKLSNDKLQSLINGSGINNIPNLNILSTNDSVNKANACSKGPVYIGSSGTDQDCIRVCANSTATVINVLPGETYISESSVLQTGANCIIGPRPECNMKTSYAMMTINSVVCRSKFPNIIGGELGSTVTACNNTRIYDPQNYLWDYKYNKKFDSWSTDFTDYNEILEDGTFRLRCKFNGYDIRENQYIEHPNDRFQPFRNYCASEIYAAHPNVKTIFKSDGTFECDCGDFTETRVQNIDPNNKQSLCSDVIQTEKDDIKDRKILTVPFKCFTLFSTLDDVGKHLPCPNDQFTREGSQFSSVSIPFSTVPDALIEHPLYADMSDSPRVFVDNGKTTV